LDNGSAQVLARSTTAGEIPNVGCYGAAGPHHGAHFGNCFFTVGYEIEHKRGYRNIESSTFKWHGAVVDDLELNAFSGLRDWAWLIWLDRSLRFRRHLIIAG
jgi:hypothetical protein